MIMSTRSRWLPPQRAKDTRWGPRLAAGVVLVILGLAQRPSAQLEHLPYMLRFNVGQDVQPIFDGWSRNADGTFEMHFGYLNRNYVEEPSAPIGPNNTFNHGQADRGQPTYFYTRTNRKAFSTTVPASWNPKEELIWTVTVNGKTNRAVGWLQPEWEIPAPKPAAAGESKNKPPTIVALNVPPTAMTGVVSLSVDVTDDGLPDPKEKRAPRKQAVGQETPPILQPSKFTTDLLPNNVPDFQLTQRGSKIRPQAPPGLSVSYMIWRAPATVEFEPYHAAVKDGKAVTSATFTTPGVYVLKARATDRALTTDKEITITVTERR